LASNVAVTEVSALRATVQAPVPAHPPPLQLLADEAADGHDLPVMGTLPPHLALGTCAGVGHKSRNHHGITPVLPHHVSLVAGHSDNNEPMLSQPGLPPTPEIIGPLMLVRGVGMDQIIDSRQLVQSHHRRQGEGLDTPS